MLFVMQAGIAVVALALLMALVGSIWMRRSEIVDGDSGSLLLGLAIAFISVVLILIAVAGSLSS